MIASHLLITDFDSVFTRIKAIVFGELDRNKEQLISSLTAAKIESVFKQFNAKAQGEASIASSVSTLFGSIEVSRLYQESAATVNDILNNQRYDQAIKVYNNKGLLAQIAVPLGQISRDFPDYVQRLISSKDGATVISAIRTLAPSITL